MAGMSGWGTGERPAALPCAKNCWLPCEWNKVLANSEKGIIIIGLSNGGQPYFHII